MEKLESLYSGIFPERAVPDNCAKQISNLTNAFDFLSLLNAFFLFALFFPSVALFVWLLGDPELPLYRLSLYSLSPLAVIVPLLVPLAIGYKKFKFEMEEFQGSYRTLVADWEFDLKWREKHDFFPPCGSEDLNRAVRAENQHSYLRFFELTHSTWGKSIFKNFSLTLPNHSCIGICSADLSAFQCIVELLKRRIDPHLGIFKLYNQDFRNFTRESVLDHFRFVGSVDLFFTGTLLENLLIHQPSARVERGRILEVLNLCDLNHLGSKLDRPLTKDLCELERFKLRMARVLLLKSPRALYLHDPFQSLSASDINAAMEILKRISATFEIVLYECFENAAAEASDFLLFFRKNKNPVLSNYRNLITIQPEFKNWFHSEKNRFHHRRILMDFALKNGQMKQFSWVAQNHSLGDLWWKNLWKSLSAPPSGSEQRFFGWRTEEQHQAARVDSLNKAIEVINRHFQDRYRIECRAHIGMSQDRLNEIHHHFEILMGQSWNPSPYLKNLPLDAHNAVRALNDLVHDYEYAMRTQSPPKGFHVVSGFQFRALPANQIPIPEECLPLFTYENLCGALVTDYCQLGKTWSEVYEDKDGHIKMENISPLRFYSASFICNFYHMPPNEAEERRKKIQNFIQEKGRANNWNIDPQDPKNALGHILLAKLEHIASNQPPTLREFSDFEGIRSITLIENDSKIRYALKPNEGNYEAAP